MVFNCYIKDTKPERALFQVFQVLACVHYIQVELSSRFTQCHCTEFVDIRSDRDKLNLGYYVETLYHVFYLYVHFCSSVKLMHFFFIKQMI